MQARSTWAKLRVFWLPRNSVSIPCGLARLFGRYWLTIPDSVTGIGQFAFAYCTGLTNVTFGKGVISIDYRAFNGCTNLTAVFFGGNTPTLGPYVFDMDNYATIYYLPGTTGWASTFGDRPAWLWNPQIRTGDASSDVRNNCFGFNITGTVGIPIVAEASPSLAHASWVPVLSCNLTNGYLEFRDAAWTNHPARFYRVRLP